jgi:hypothetical protein
MEISEKYHLNKYQMVMATIICEAIRISRTERKKVIKRGVDGEEKVGRLDVRTAIYAMEGIKNISDETLEALGKIRPLPQMFLNEQSRCWNAVFEMIDRQEQLVNGEDEDDYEGLGWIKIYPDSDFGKYISCLLLEEDIEGE